MNETGSERAGGHRPLGGGGAEVGRQLAWWARAMVLRGVGEKARTRRGMEGRKHTREAVFEGGVGEEPDARVGRGENAGSKGFGRRTRARLARCALRGCWRKANSLDRTCAGCIQKDILLLTKLFLWISLDERSVPAKLKDSYCSSHGFTIAFSAPSAKLPYGRRRRRREV